MKATLLFILLFLSSVFADSNLQISENRHNKLIKKGEKVSKKLCDEKKLSKITTKSFDEISKQIDELKPCIALNKRNKKALIYFLLSKDKNSSIKKEEEVIDVPKDSKCPVCGMIINKYPKWVAFIKVEDKKYYFDGVKDMMKFYIFDADFPYDRSKIEEIKVTNFYTLKGIDAKKAFYVIGSDVYGPMGEELVPFETKKEAQNFMKDHHADKIIQFQDITPKIVMALDGIEYNE